MLRIAFVFLLSTAISSIVLAQAKQTEKPQPSPVGMVEQASKAVFLIRVKAEGSTFATGTGFIIDSSGLAITNFHVIQGASQADAVLSGSTEAIPVKLVAACPKLDLALVSLPAKDPRLVGVRPLIVRSGVPAIANEVWALGYPKLGFTVTRGIVSGVREFSDLPKELMSALRYDATSTWVQTDCTINAGNSGGPLLDSDGQVVGINTWVAKTGQNLYFALSSRHIAEFLDMPRSPEYSFAVARKEFGKISVPRASVPRLEVTQNLTGLQILQDINRFRDTYKCSSCSGHGNITSRVQVDQGPLALPTFKHVTRSCPTCNTTGFAMPETLWRAAARVTSSVARLKLDDSKYDAVRKQFTTVMQSSLTQDLSRISKSLNTIALSKLTGTDCKIGESILLVGTLEKDFSSHGGADRLQGVKFLNSKLVVIIMKPHTVDATEGEQVVVGGLLAGRVDGPDGELLPVLQDGFVFACRSLGNK